MARIRFGQRIWTGPESRLLAGALGILALYLAPFFVLGEDATILIHDNLDSNLVWFKILASSGLVFGPGDAVVPNLLGGIPRAAFGPELDVHLWLYMAFEPFTAYVLNQVLLRGVAFAGMFLLLRSHVLPGDEPWAPRLRVGCALAFALLPFWPSGGLAIAGQPLAANALLNIRDGSRRTADWAAVVLLPLYANLVMASMFGVLAFGVYAACDALRTRRIRLPFWGAIALHGLLLCAVEYRLFLAILADPSFVSHRVEFVPVLRPLGAAFAAGVRLLLEGQYHAASLHAPVILTTSAIALLLAWRQREGWQPLLVCLLPVLGICMFYALWRWEGFAGARGLFSLGVGFAADRFYTLLPVLWALGFALSLAIVARAVPRGPLLASGLLALQVGHVFVQSDFLDGRLDHGISYRAFYAREQFAAIEKEIGLPQASYRVASLGLHPAVAQFNGFHTADGYFPSYPLAHKHALRAVMRHELARDPALARYFDEWGNRAYVYSAEIERRFLDTAAQVELLRELQLDPEALRVLDVRFVLSAAPIESPGRSGLVYRRSFSHPDSAWRIHLYERPERFGVREGSADDAEAG